jgi:hypothetical protein
MSTLKRKIENIEIEGKKYIMAFDMASVDLFQELNGTGVLQSVIKLNKLDDKTVLDFIASTLRPDDDVENPIGEKLYTGDFDLFTVMIMLVPKLIAIINEGFPRSDNEVEEIKN